MEDTKRAEKTREEWQRELPPERYHILFEEGTEPPGSSPLNYVSERGTYICAACGNPLFRSETKYDAGCGWPSFTRPLEGSLATKPDYKLVTPRVEYHCSRCGGHQGHVFDDGPAPEGLRFCNNGLSLEFIPDPDDG